MMRGDNQHDEIHNDDADKLEGLKYNPNEREHEPLDLEDMEMENQGCTPQQPKFDDDSDTYGLKHAGNVLRVLRGGMPKLAGKWLRLNRPGN